MVCTGGGRTGGGDNSSPGCGGERDSDDNVATGAIVDVVFVNNRRHCV